MGNINFIAIEILVLGILLTLVPFVSLIFITIFFLSQLYFIFKLKTISYYIIPIIFLVHSFFSINFKPIHEGDIIIARVNLVKNSGRVEKISGKHPLKNIYLHTKKLSDGKYIIKGNITKISKNKVFYKINTLNKEKISRNKFETLFYNKFNSLTEHTTHEIANLFRGVILGEKRYISKDIRENFLYSGAGHLLAVSGLHMGIILGLALLILEKLKFKRNIKYLIALILISIYILGVNRSPSLIRAYIMAVTFIVGKMLYEKNDLKKSFSTALIISLLFFPASCNNVSFVFSYLSLFSIIYIYPKCKIENSKRNKKYVDLYNFLIFTGIIQIFIAPATFYFFQTLPLFSYVTNIFITAIGSLFTMLSAISMVLPVFIFRFGLSFILERIYTILDTLLNIFSKVPYLSLEFFKKPPLNFIVFIYIILIGIFYRKEIKKLLKDIFRGEKDVL